MLKHAGNADSVKAISKEGQEIFMQLENSSKPVVAAVHGVALGGGCEVLLLYLLTLFSKDCLKKSFIQLLIFCPCEVYCICQYSCKIVIDAFIKMCSNHLLKCKLYFV